MTSPIVVLPASSRTGAQVVKKLLESGHQVRAAARVPSKLNELQALGAEVVVGDLSKPETIHSALENSGALFFVTPDGSDPIRDAERNAQVLTGALEGSKIERVVFLSSIGAEQTEETGSILTLHIVEEALKKFSSKVEIVILRCPWFVENWIPVAQLALSSPFTLPSLLLPIDRPIPHISTCDIAVYAVKYLTISSSALSPNDPTIVEILGPKELSPIDIGAGFEKVNGGNKVEVIAVEDKDFESTLEDSLSKVAASHVAEMMRAINGGRIVWSKSEKVVREQGETALEVTLSEMRL